jgi:hypothetical protein
MATVLLDMVISLDGLICGPGGADGGLHDLYFNSSEVSGPIVDELVSTTGAIVVGRGAFAAGDAAGGWDYTPYQGAPLRGDPPATAGATHGDGRVQSSSRTVCGPPSSMPSRRRATAMQPSEEAPTLLSNVWPSAWWTRCSCTSYPFCSETGCPCSTAPVPDGA